MGLSRRYAVIGLSHNGRSDRTVKQISPKKEDLGALCMIGFCGRLAAKQHHDFAPHSHNLNHPTRRGMKSRAGKRVSILTQGPGVGAAQAPARTHNALTLASSSNLNTPKECKNTSKREAKQD